MQRLLALPFIEVIVADEQFGEQDVCQFELLIEELLPKFFLLKKPFYNGEIITGVETQETKLTDEFHRSVPHTAKEVYKVCVVVVIHLKLVGDGLAREDSTRTYLLYASGISA